MRRKLLFLNIVLLVMLLFGTAELVSRIYEAEERHSSVLAKTEGKDSPSLPGPEEAVRLRPANFRTIVDRLLFSPDRNPVIEVEEPEQERAERPAYPLLVGVMDFGEGPIAMMSETARGTPRPVAVGEKVGEFTFLAVVGDRITLEWSGQKFEVGEEELTGATKEPANRRVNAGIQRPVVTRSSTKAASSGNLGGGKPKSVSGKHYIGSLLSGQVGRRAADPNDGVADGTRSQGWVRRVRKTPFGSQHWWEAQPK